jgi:cell division cycle 2-like protein
MSSRRGKWDSDSDGEDKAVKKNKGETKKKARREPMHRDEPVEPIPTPIQGSTVPIIEQHSTLSIAVSSSSSSSSYIAANTSRKPPCRSVECYERLNFIDQGTYGFVFRARCKQTNEVYALKQIKLSAEAGRSGFPITAFREINILLALRHENIIQVREMVVGSTIDKIYMVMEYYENDLKAVMKTSRQSFSTAEVVHLNPLHSMLSACFLTCFPAIMKG